MRMGRMGRWGDGETRGKTIWSGSILLPNCFLNVKMPYAQYQIPMPNPQLPITYSQFPTHRLET